jgi:MFS family permease
MSPDAKAVAAVRAKLPRAIWALGLTSLFMDVSSEMIHSLLPVYLVVVLASGGLWVGIIEGVAEGTAAFGKLVSGALSDRWRRRKPLALAGYGLAALSKPLFPLAGSVGMVMLARFLDRVGKGVRVAPRDALVADITPRERIGAAYGLRQGLDTIGAFAGPLIAAGLMALTGDFTTVFWLAVPPAFLAVVVLAVMVHEPPPGIAATVPRRPILTRADLARLGGACWALIAIGAVLSLARFSEAFLLLKADSVGATPAAIPLVLVAMNLVYSLSAYPVGALSDRIGRIGLMIAGMAVLAVANLALSVAGGLVAVMAGAALWGLHMGLSQGLITSLIADHAPVELRGTAFGAFHLSSGVALIAGGVLAGGLWDLVGPATTFVAGAGLTVLPLVGLLVFANRG